MVDLNQSGDGGWHHHYHHHNLLPKRIILVRHGESQGNLDTAAYSHIPDHKIPLTEAGRAQARETGAQLHDLISSDCGNSTNTWRVYFYVSPYDRTRSTLREIGKAFDRKRIIGVREECRVREQDFGNFQVAERMKVIKEARERFGRFFFRFPEGESAADVFDRVSRVFLMKWFKWTVEQFELLNNPENCEFRVMQLGAGGEYSLAIHHTEEELREWGLSEAMIADQKCRASASKGNWNENCPWFLDEFFDPPLEELSKENDECYDLSQESSPMSINSKEE
ncbi:unnamed protein product [Linum tenue]|uniref:Phosphoglycerate mutase-like protein AT74H n=1 Tax=Linum tenue TaxID=586396 RepID=A0AAV0R3Q2_9ROSI|nr:unnamed protein product [Linum tenue]CAI0551082.1 unnamed protein product [Linum tenue]